MKKWLMNVHFLVNTYFFFKKSNWYICIFLAKPQCFSLNDTAKTPDGEEISIENLKIGEKVLAIDRNDQIITSEIVAILHFEKKLEGKS